MNDDLKEFDDGISAARDRVYSFRKIRYIVKILGVIGMFVSIYLHYWLSAVLLWLLFFPDLNEFVKFFKRKQNV